MEFPHVLSNVIILKTKKRVYYLSASTESVMNSWVEAISCCIEESKPGYLSNGIEEEVEDTDSNVSYHLLYTGGKIAQNCIKKSSGVRSQPSLTQ